MNLTKVRFLPFSFLLFFSYFSFTAATIADNTETRPRLTHGCGENLLVKSGTTESIDLDAHADGCDTLIWSIGSITPDPVGTVTISRRGKVRFSSDIQDSGVYTIQVIVANENGAADSCTVTFDVFIPTPYKLRIQTVHNSFMGSAEQVDVTLEKGSSAFTGFDLLIAYEDSLIDLLTVLPSERLFSDTGCGWEYFDYQVYPGGIVRVTGRPRKAREDCRADCPITGLLPVKLFTLDVLVGKDRCRSDCSFHPIRFVWLDCNSNVIDQDKNEPSLISRSIYDLIWYGEDIADSTPNVYPTYLGAQLCADSCRTELERFADFYNGGIDLICSGDIDASGDINLNEYRYEIADVELYAEYFLRGLDVFRINQQGQIQASDVNYDSLTLTVADLAFMTNIIANNLTIPEFPCQSIAPPVIDLTYHVCNGVVAVDRPIGAALLVAKGNVKPKKLAKSMAMRSFFDGQNTHILMYTDLNDTTAYAFDGEFVAGIDILVSAEFGTLTGGMVNATLELPCDTTPFKVRIEKVHDANQGQHVSVDVVL